MDKAGVEALHNAFKDDAGSEALRNITASANGGPVGAAQGNRFVPTVTEVEGGRERGYDLFSLLMKQRIVLLEGQVDDTMASIACASLLYLNSPASGNPTDPITVHVNSPGGSVLAGLAIYDTMRSIAAPIKTVGYGMQASMGSILLVAGDERWMTRSSKYMIHQPLGGNGQSTQQTDMVISADLITRLREDLTDIYVRHTGLKHEFWDKVLERDTWLTADQALEMGVISEIVTGSRKKTIHEEFSHRSEKEDARLKQIEGKSALEIIALMNSAEGSTVRPECVVALSKMPEYWTPSRAAQEAEKTKAQAAANNNSKGAAKKKTAPKRSRAKRANGGPTL
ncbi:MAG: hypothetical protein GC185_13305 [Alphaproteobacteria bacterium]|nr:hypothetical protein [Alphaproteobacteria bacterium]